MKILVVCHRPPLLATDGGSMAAASLIAGLLDAGQSVQVVAVETDRHPSRIEGPEVSEMAAATSYTAFHVDTRITPWRAVRGLFQDSFNVRRFDSAVGDRVIGERLRSGHFDLVVLDSLFSTPYLAVIRATTDAPVILRAQNIEHEIWDRTAATSRWPTTWYLAYLARQLRRYEATTFRAVDGVAAISPDDEAAIAALVPGVRVGLVEIGLADRYEPALLPREAPLCSLANYDWAPNVEGMAWFVDEVWPHIRAAAPDTRFDIAGWHSDRFRHRFERPGIRVLGPVPSPQEFLTTRGVVVAPLLAGSGVRVKLIESMLLAKPVVTTTVGGRGLYTDPDRPLKVRDDPAAFARAVLELVADHELAAALGQAARDTAEKRFSRHTVTQQLLGLAERIQGGVPR